MSFFRRISVMKLWIILNRFFLFVFTVICLENTSHFSPKIKFGFVFFFLTFTVSPLFPYETAPNQVFFSWNSTNFSYFFVKVGLFFPQKLIFVFGERKFFYFFIFVELVFFFFFFFFFLTSRDPYFPFTFPSWVFFFSETQQNLIQ